MELKTLIKNTEERIFCYKKLLEDVFKNKINYSTDEFTIWYKTILRENKNFEEFILKSIIEEKTYEKDGLNPPFCYKF